MPDISDKHNSTIQVIVRATDEEFQGNTINHGPYNSDKMKKILRDLDFGRIGGDLNQLFLKY